MEPQKTSWIYKMTSVLSFLVVLIMAFMIMQFFIFSDFSGSFIEWTIVLAFIIFLILGFETWMGKKWAMITSLILILCFLSFGIIGLIFGLGLQGAMSFL